MVYAAMITPIAGIILVSGNLPSKTFGICRIYMYWIKGAT